MSYAQLGLLVLAAALLLGHKLEFDLRRAKYAILAALAAFLTVIVFDGLLVLDHEKEYLVVMHVGSVLGWLMLMVALVRGCGVLSAPDGGPGDSATGESADREKERVRQEIREKFAERDRELEK